MTQKSDGFEMIWGPNVIYITDANGMGWMCYGASVNKDEVRGLGRVPDEEIIYDRMFGG